MKLIMTHYILLCLCIPCLVSSLDILHTFRDPEDNHFQKMTVDEDTGHVYIGGTNRLHQLTRNLSLIHSVITGPRDDNPNCPPPIIPCSEDSKIPTASVTKGLVIDRDDRSLILCTSLFHGTCEILKLENITNANVIATKPVVPNTEDGSCVMVIAPGANQSNSLYIGAEYTSVGSERYRDLVPSISSRELKSLEFVHRDIDGGTRMSLINENRRDFRLKFVFAFASSGYVYFVVNQKKDLKSSEWVTRISRLCQGDRYFRSYVEIPLECRAEPSFIAQAATMMGGDSLVLSFSPEGNSKGPSTICRYWLQDINKVFDDTVKSCYAGQGKVGPAHYQAIRPCMVSPSPVDFCASTDFYKAHPALEGRQPVQVKSLLTLSSEHVTALRATHEGGHNLLHAGTQDGYILRILVQKSSAVVVKRLYLGMSQPVLDVVNSNLPERVYALTKSKVFIDIYGQQCL